MPPEKYSDPIVLQSKIDEYFKMCDEHITEVQIGKTIKKVHKPYLIIGLCHYLDIDYKTFETWNKVSHKHFRLATRAKRRIEINLNEMALIGLYDTKTTLATLARYSEWQRDDQAQQTNIQIGIVSADLNEIITKIQSSNIPPVKAIKP
jgi:hypothetical protein